MSIIIALSAIFALVLLSYFDFLRKGSGISESSFYDIPFQKATISPHEIAWNNSSNESGSAYFFTR